MAILHTRINPRSDEFLRNRAALLLQVEDLRSQLNNVQQGGGPKAQERHTSRGKLLPRERINRLLDIAVPGNRSTGCATRCMVKTSRRPV